jgi:hypothetical protein
MKSHSLAGVLLLATALNSICADPIAIGDRRELFVDGHLIHELKDGATRRLHHPRAREVVLQHDAPWEGAGSAYHTVIRDGDRYRMYYRGCTLGVLNGRLKVGKQVYCYAESRDGIRWQRPKLGLFEHNGSKENNIILTGLGVHNFAPFLDKRTGCPPEARFKALAGSAKEGGLFAEPGLLGRSGRKVPSLLSHFHCRGDDGQGLEARRISGGSHRQFRGFSGMEG